MPWIHVGSTCNTHTPFHYGPDLVKMFMTLSREHLRRCPVVAFFVRVYSYALKALEMLYPSRLSNHIISILCYSYFENTCIKHNILYGCFAFLVIPPCQLMHSAGGGPPRRKLQPHSSEVFIQSATACKLTGEDNYGN